MLDTRMLAFEGDQVTLLDQQTLASINGGEGIKEWLAKQIGSLLFDCISGSLDAIISAAEEGYEDAR
jgi:hypothetical protein